MKPSEILLKAAEYMDDGCMFGACGALDIVDASDNKLARQYLELFRPRNAFAGFWFGPSRAMKVLSTITVSESDLRRNTHERVLCLLMAAAIAKSEGN